MTLQYGIPVNTTYMAQWYEDDCYDRDGEEILNFNPDVMHESYHDTLDEAKRAAFINASRHDAVGVAYAHVLYGPLSNEDDLLFRNEVCRGKWSGWEQIA